MRGMAIIKMENPISITAAWHSTAVVRSYYLESIQIEYSKAQMAELKLLAAGGISLSAHGSRPQAH